MKPIVIAAGGTGGHFFPAEALAAELIARGHRVVLMTDARSGALKSAVFVGSEQHILAGTGLAGRGVLRAARGLAALAVGTLQARRILHRLEPAAIVGFGGYPCVPPVVAARSLRRRPLVVLQEQNAVLGRANRYLTRFADFLALGVEFTKRIPVGVHTIFTANPVRPAIAALTGQPYEPPGRMVDILVLGGSLGARVFSDIVPAAIELLPLPLRARLAVTQQCRAEDLPKVAATYKATGVPALLAPFFDDVATHLTRAHIVIARAGASTCAELRVAGRPSILVPLPGAIDDHQVANAADLVNAGAARMLAQRDFTAETLAAALVELLGDPARLSVMAREAARTARPDAAARLADLIANHCAKAEMPA